MSYERRPEQALVLHGMAQMGSTSYEAIALREAGADVVAPDLVIAREKSIIEISLDDKERIVTETLKRLAEKGRDPADIVVVSQAHFVLERVMRASPILFSHSRQVVSVTPPIYFPASNYSKFHREPSKELEAMGAAKMMTMGSDEKRIALGFTQDYLDDSQLLEKDAKNRIESLFDAIASLGLALTVVVPWQRDPVGFSYKDRAEIAEGAPRSLLAADWMAAPSGGHGIGAKYGRDIARMVLHGMHCHEPDEMRLISFNPLQNESTDQ